MIMRGDLEKIFNQINPVFETAFNRIEALTERVNKLEEELESVKGTKPAPKRGPGRPPKAKKAA